MNRLKMFTLLFFSLFISWTTHAQQLFELSMEYQSVEESDTVKMDVAVSNFMDIVSMQFSINWDPSIITYLNTDDSDLDHVAATQTASDILNGYLRISWFDIDGIGESLVDGQAVLRLNFKVIGNIGDTTDLKITDTPIQIEIAQKGEDGNYILDETEMNLHIGTVEVVESSGSQVSVAATTEEVSCNGAENGAIDLVVQGEGSYFYEWAGPNEFSSNEPDLDNLTSGDYELSIFDEDGILVFDSTFVITQPLSALLVDEIQADTTDCLNPNGSAIVNTSGGTAPYSYDIGLGATNENIFNSLPVGSYALTITDANDCTVVEDFAITSPNTPQVDLGEDAAICEGEETFLEAGNFQNYEWSTGESDAGISVVETGEYSVTVTNEHACTATDTVYIEIEGLIRLSVESDSLGICPGDSVQLLVTGGIDYLWLDPTEALAGITNESPKVSPEINTTYAVVSENSCSIDTAFIYVEVHEIVATAGQDTCIAAGQGLYLNASGGEYYYWIQGDYPLSSYEIPNPYSEPEDSSTYSILIIDENNCSTIDSVRVLVGSDPLRFITRINAITPNGDGKNDVLDFGSIDKYGQNTLRVFNRWGDILYERVGYQNDDARFNGTYNEKPLPAGVYYYVLSFREGQSLKQTLTIIRE